MASLDSVRQKLYRAKCHRDELYRELVAYYESDPGDLFEAPGSTPRRRVYLFREKDDIPARLGLICGDSLQCLRSSLDYLVWELVEAAGNPTHGQLMFPISMKTNYFKNALTDRKRLSGIDADAAKIIDTLQPYRLADPTQSQLAMLDELTNINKHRRVILTSLAGSTLAIPESSPCVLGFMREIGEDGHTNDVPISGCITIQDGFAKDIEIINFLDVTAQFIGDKILPLFEQFFK